MEPVRLGFVGCGSHAFRSHAIVAAQMPDLFSIVALHDIRQEPLNRFFELAPEVERKKSYEELLRVADLEAIVIGTPDDYHLEQARAAVAAGKHVLCEKPVWVGTGMSETKGLALFAEAERKGLVFTSCHPRRFDPEYRWYRENLPRFTERFGRVLEFNYRFFYEKPTTSWKRERSLLLDHLNHEIDLANFILGHSKTRLRKLFDGFDRYAVAGCREDGTAIAFCGHRKLNEYAFWNELDVVFERKRIINYSVLTQSGIVRPRRLEWILDTRDPHVTSVPCAAHHYSDCFAGIMRNFARSIRGLEPNYLTFDDLRVNTIAGNALVAYSEYAG
jgi:predicted dehydrogenase